MKVTILKPPWNCCVHKTYFDTCYKKLMCHCKNFSEIVSWYLWIQSYSKLFMIFHILSMYNAKMLSYPWKWLVKMSLKYNEMVLDYRVNSRNNNDVCWIPNLFFLMLIKPEITAIKVYSYFKDNSKWSRLVAYFKGSFSVIKRDEPTYKLIVIDDLDLLVYSTWTSAKRSNNSMIVSWPIRGPLGLSSRSNDRFIWNLVRTKSWFKPFGSKIVTTCTAGIFRQI